MTENQKTQKSQNTTTQDPHEEANLAQAKEQLAPKTIEKAPRPGDEQAP